MTTFLTSFSTLAIAEVADKTQFVTLFLVTRYRKPYAILAGVFCAALVSQMISTWILSLFFTTLPQIFLDCLIAALFFWTSYELFQIQSYTQSFKNTNSDTVKKTFLWTFALFLVAEMGDKTQFLGASLATASQTPWLVILGSSCGITLANLPIVFFGQNIIQRFRQSLICKTAGFTFALMGLWYTAKVVGN